MLRSPHIRANKSFQLVFPLVLSRTYLKFIIDNPERPYNMENRLKTYVITYYCVYCDKEWERMSIDNPNPSLNFCAICYGALVPVHVSDNLLN